MKVVLFCGGLGMRLREYSESTPKPMVPVGYRPILWHVMRYYAHYGHKDFILCLGSHDEVIGGRLIVVEEVPLDGVGDAGLRSGEIIALEWIDVDLMRGVLKVQRSDYKGHVTLPKSGKPRIVPMTARLVGALKAHRHLRGDRVLCHEDGKSVTRWWVKAALEVAERRAGLRRGGRIHILRHTFCSRLAARNVPAISIQHLAGHAGLESTQRYLHLGAAAPWEAIRALEAVSSPRSSPNLPARDEPESNQAAE